MQFRPDSDVEMRVRGGEGRRSRFRKPRFSVAAPSDPPPPHFFSPSRSGLRLLAKVTFGFFAKRLADLGEIRRRWPRRQSGSDI